MTETSPRAAGAASDESTRAGTDVPGPLQALITAA